MILLLSGASETARMVVVDKLLDDHADWRHLALEDLREEGEWDDEIGMEEILGTMIACDRANDVHEEGNPVVVTCPTLALLDTARDSLPSTIITVHMGEESDAPDHFDHIISAKESAKRTYEMLSSIIG